MNDVQKVHKYNPNVQRNGNDEIEGEGGDGDRDELLGGEYRNDSNDSNDSDNGMIQRLPTDISNPDLITYDYNYNPNQRS